VQIFPGKEKQEFDLVIPITRQQEGIDRKLEQFSNLNSKI